jgi:hypothetical protein
MQWKKLVEVLFFFGLQIVRPAVYLMIIQPQHFPFSKLLCFSKPATLTIFKILKQTDYFFFLF